MVKTENQSFGLTLSSIRLIKEELQKYSEIEKVIIYGSRAMGNYKKGSDVDLALVGTHVTRDTVTRLHCRLNEELPLPWYFDVLNYDHLENENLKNHIDREGITFYKREDHLSD